MDRIRTRALGDPSDPKASMVFEKSSDERAKSFKIQVSVMTELLLDGTRAKRVTASILRPLLLCCAFSGSTYQDPL
ncbi:hypothetical protein E2C01_039362 [Portunus trituberculatus]|uniref:Uncharacterized protein n=1 Tax=Portunus trituberculatus TaxID=210409 RepID=A0A5B7FJN7_PORTR|nr:hypothetical protein [Portunus trituberculatus]